jgi:methylisocitrate lyase
MKKALEELKRTGDYTGMSEDEWVTARKQVEDLIGLEDYYRIEQATVEKMYAGSRRRNKNSPPA